MLLLGAMFETFVPVGNVMHIRAVDYVRYVENQIVIGSVHTLQFLIMRIGASV